MQEIARQDVLVVGAGLAGLLTALKLAPLKVGIVAAAPLSVGASSAWAQGGIAVALSAGDSADQHTADTLKAGCYLNDKDMVDILTHEARDAILDLSTYGIAFDKTNAGDFIQGQEAAHSHRRIVKVGGDGAGRTIMSHLSNAVLGSSHITMYDSYIMVDLAKNAQGDLCGLYARAVGSEIMTFFKAPQVVLATGGVGYLYQDTTNPYQIRGESLGIAYRHKVALKDAEFVQFHPTALDIGLDPCPLATEALRGEGAWLVDGDDRRIMENIHPDLELAPRDIVARALTATRFAGHQTFLDTRECLGDRIETDFPIVFQSCLKAGINPITDKIPVKPAQHYHMGGIATDSHGCSSMQGLYVVGEAACTGVHGANRLASNSLLEAVVFARRSAKHLLGSILGGQENLVPVGGSRFSIDRDVSKKYLIRLRMLMTREVGIIRTQAGLAKAKNQILSWLAETEYCFSFQNYAMACLAIIDAAMQRSQSIGAHYVE